MQIQARLGAGSSRELDQAEKQAAATRIIDIPAESILHFKLDDDLIVQPEP
jgi:hypothetical protein